MKEKNGFLLIGKYRGAIMGLAALWILFFHEWQPLFANVAGLGVVEKFIKRIGFCGVDMFLFLSGIGLTFSVGKTSLGTFYYRRFKRLVVPFLAIAVLRAVLENWKFTTFLKNVTGISFYTRSMYSYLWFVTAIATLYLLFPIYYALLKRAKSPTLFTAGALMLWLILSLYFRNGERGDLYGFTNRIPVFLVGVWAGWSTQHRKSGFTAGTWLFFVVMLLLGGYLSYLSNYKGLYILVPVSNCCIPNLLMSVSLCFLLAKLCQLLCESRGVRVIGKPLTAVLRFYGLFTLELYCVQEWIAGQILKELIAAYSLPAVNLIMLTVCTLAGSALYLVQLPLWRGIDAILRKMGCFKAPMKITVRELPVRRAETTEN